MDARIAEILIVALIGLLQGIILFTLKQYAKKIDNICINITTLQQDIGLKADEKDHQKVEVKLGQYGDRILTLELAVKVIEKEASRER
jgi:hypothetical protein